MSNLRATVSILLVIVAALVEGQQVRRYVILPPTEAAAVSKLGSRRTPQRIGGGWQLPMSVIEGLEANFPLISKMRIEGWPPAVHIDEPTNYYRQYVGVVVAQRRLVYVNAMCHKPIGEWYAHLFNVMDGATCVFGVLYDPETKSFFDLEINGRA